MAVCRSCKRENRDGANFCRYCGTTLQSRVVVQAEPPRIEVAFCQKCNANVEPGKRLCDACARPAAPPKPPIVIPEHIRADVGRFAGGMAAAASNAAANLSLGGKIAAIGGALAFIACWLPMASGVGAESALLPTLFSEMNRTPEAGYLLVLPLSAVAIVIMALAAMSGAAHKRAMLGGACIAVGSPWMVLCLMMLMAASKVLQSLGAFSFGAGIGIGAVVMALGFVGAVAGAFVILWEAVMAANTSGYDA